MQSPPPPPRSPTPPPPLPPNAFVSAVPAGSTATEDTHVPAGSCTTHPTHIFCVTCRHTEDAALSAPHASHPPFVTDAVQGRGHSSPKVKVCLAPNPGRALISRVSRLPAGGRRCVGREPPWRTSGSAAFHSCPSREQTPRKLCLRPSPDLLRRRRRRRHPRTPRRPRNRCDAIGPRGGWGPGPLPCGSGRATPRHSRPPEAYRVWGVRACHGGSARQCRSVGLVHDLGSRPGMQVGGHPCVGGCARGVLEPASVVCFCGFLGRRGRGFVEGREGGWPNCNKQLLPGGS